MPQNRLLLGLISGLLLFFLASCAGQEGVKQAQDASGTGENPVKQAEPKADPVHLGFYQFSGSITDEEFQTLVVNPVKKKYPNITLELIRSGKGTTPEELVAAGNMPDIIFTGSSGALTISQLSAGQDLNSLIKKANMDVGKFDPTAMQAIRLYSDKKQTLAVPFSINFSALYYNKDIFDKFAVPYPSDGMTWDQAIEVARKVTREVDGVSYKGLEFDSGIGGAKRMGEQLESPLVNPKTLKAALNTDGWKKALNTMLQIKSIPGNINKKKPIPSFEQDREVAMMAGLGARLGEINALAIQGKPINYDLATMPVFTEKPHNAFGMSLFLLMLSSTGKHQEQAFQVIQLLTDNDVQTMLNKQGRLTSLKDAKLKDSFGEEMFSFKGKNKQAVFKVVPAPQLAYTLYDKITNNELNAAVNQMLDKGVDVNTALRQAEEKANQAIEAQKQ
jgi:multiple sugar transport system substrate-binding protein